MLQSISRSTVIAATSLVMLIVGSEPVVWAHGDVKHLKGNYDFTVHVSFATDVTGFDSNLARLGGGTTNNGIASGTVQYNGDGTGSAAIQFLRVNHTSNGVGQQPVEQGELTCTLTYTVDADHSFSVQETCTGTIIAGAFDGQTILASTITFRGKIAQGGDILLITDTVPDVETRTRTDGVNNFTTYSVGGRSGVAIKVK